MVKKEDTIQAPPPEAPVVPENESGTARQRHSWAALAIIALWLAVTLVGVYAETDFVISTSKTHVEVPVVWGVAAFATAATWVITVSAFRRD